MRDPDIKVKPRQRRLQLRASEMANNDTIKKLVYSQVESLQCSNEKNKVAGGHNIKTLSSTVLHKLKTIKRAPVVTHDPCGSFSLSIWDLGGQPLFNSVHHLYLSDKAIYVLVYDIEKMKSNRDNEVETLGYWLDSISLFAEHAAVLIVGTLYGVYI